MNRLGTTAVTLAAALSLSACEADSADMGTGELAVTIWGEGFVEEGLTAADFHDVWAVTFSRYLVAYRDIAISRGDSTPAVTLPESRVYDLTVKTSGKGQAVATETVPAGAYDHTAYRIAPPAEGALGPAAEADIETMRTNGWSVWVAGEATKGGVTKTFSWGFDIDTQYDPCDSTAVVTDGGAATTQLTVHGEHLFYDDLVSAEPNVAFDLVAASDTDGDGAITKEELLARDITAEARYQVGNEDITNLWDFIRHQARTIGHIDGEGDCAFAAR
ncbi:MAG: hypothetical protein AMXMBFR64_62080 [Myxococcales bacterium]